MHSTPLVSVMMAAYNAEKFIRKSIESILDQTYQNWELIILNDGSIDGTRAIVKQFFDPRIKYFENEQNMGLVYTRNRMITLAAGEYLAVLDSDDVAYSDRLEKEVLFLNKNPLHGLVGSSIEMIDAKGNLTGETWNLPAKSKDIATILFFHNNFAHSTVMFRRSVLPNPVYREGFAPSEDFDLWVRLSQISRVYNFKKSLVAYRKHDNNTSFSNQERLFTAEKKIIFENVSRVLGLVPDALEVDLLYKVFFYRNKFPIQDNDIEKLENLMQELWRSFPGVAKNMRKGLFASLLLRYYLIVLNSQGYSFCKIILKYFSIRIGSSIRKSLFLLFILFEKTWNAFFLRIFKAKNISK